MIDHFHESVIYAKRISGRVRAMQCKTAFDAYLEERKIPFKSIVAFSGSHEYQGKKDVTETTMNGFPSTKIFDYFEGDEIKGIQAKAPYRFLIVADKFQSGFDQPLLHKM